MRHRIRNATLRRIRGGFMAVTALSCLAQAPPTAAQMLGPGSVSLHVGTRPQCVRSADLDGNGAVDLVVGNTGEDTVSVILGDGSGAFVRGLDTVVGAGPSSVAIQDLDGDAVPDLVVAARDDRVVTVLRGDGQGRFSFAVELGTGGAPESVAVADLDGDDVPDLAVAVPGMDQVLVYSGNGLGGFQSETVYAVGGAPARLLLVDVDLDGNRDIVVARRADTSLALLSGDGSGGFAVRPGTAIGSPQHALVAADFNADGTPDLAVLGENGSVVPLIGDGAGTFVRGVEVEVGAGAASLTIADFDLDGRQDLAVALPITHQVSLLRGDGTGGLSSAGAIAVGVQPIALDDADFNGDGAPDLVVANLGSDTASVVLGDGLGDFARNETLGARSPVAVLVDDLGGIDAAGAPLAVDGVPDLAIVSFLDSAVRVLTGDGAGGFSQVIDVPTGLLNDFPAAMISGDFNEDGSADLAVAKWGAGTSGSTGGAVTVLLGQVGTGYTRAADTPVGAEPFGIEAADFDLDGSLDLVTANSGEDSLSVLWGDGSGAFPESTRLNVGTGPLSVATGDFDRDGAPDLAVAVRDGVAVVSSSGSRMFPEPQLIDAFPASARPNSVAVGRIDADDALDLAVASGVSNTVTIHYGDGTGTFSSGAVLHVANNPRAVCIVDLNSDGVADLAVANELSDSVTVFLQRGARQFLQLNEIDVGNSPFSLAAIDLDGDGAEDLAVAAFFENNVTLLSNQRRLRADVNGSNRVDGFDVNTVSRLAGKSFTDPEYRPNADVDLGGLVDGDDLTDVAARFGEFNRSETPLLGRFDPLPPAAAPDTVSLRAESTGKDRVEIAVFLNTALPVASAQFDVVFDADVLVYENFAKGPYFTDFGQDTPQPFDAAFIIDNAVPGRASIRIDQVFGEPLEADRPGTALILEFRGRSEGQTMLEFAPSRADDPPRLFDADGREVAVSFVSELGVRVENPGGALARRLGTYPQTLDFGVIDVGSQARRTLRVSNFGFAPLTVSDVSLSDPAFLGRFDDAFVVPPYGFVLLPVVFLPETVGDFHGELVLETDDQDNRSKVIPLAGSAVVRQ